MNQWIIEGRRKGSHDQWAPQNDEKTKPLAEALRDTYKRNNPSHEFRIRKRAAGE